MLDLTRLRVFREVAARRSFSSAAEALNYTQSAVSQQVSKLERDVGLTLLDRAHRPIGLTEAGETLLRRVDLIFGEVAAAEADLGALAGLKAGTLRIGGFATACATVLPGAIKLFGEQHSGVSVSLAEMEPSLARRRLRAGEIDLAVAYRFADAAHTRAADGIAEVEIARDPFVLALPGDHPLAGRRSVRLEQLRDERWLGASGAGAGDYRDFLVGACRAAGFDPAIAYEPGDLWTGRGIIAAGLAVGLMPRLAFALPAPGIATVKLSGASPSRMILGARMEGRRVPAVDPMLDCLRSVFAQMGAHRGSGVGDGAAAVEVAAAVDVA